MVIKTKIHLEEFHQILSGYSLGTLVKFSPIQPGTVQSNYYVETVHGKYVFRLYENRSIESVLFERDLLLYLKRFDFACPALILNRQRETVGTLKGKPYLLFEFFEGEHIENLDQGQRYDVIQNVAELQVLTRNYHSKYRNDRLNYSPTSCWKLARQTAQNLNTDHGYQKLSWMKKQLASLQLPASLPMGICHCDFHFANLLFHDGVFVALIDFDDANYTYLTFDLVCLVDSWAWTYPSESPDWMRAREITQAYEVHRPLSMSERHHIFDVHKLSILFDCIWFFGRGTGREFYERKKIEHLDNLGRDRYEHALFPG